MAIAFSDLPSTAINRIGSFIDVSSLLQMREVSKTTKKVVDVIASNRKTKMHGIEIRPFHDRIRVRFWFSDEMPYGDLYKIYVVSTIAALGFDYHQVSIMEDRDEDDTELCATLLSELELKRFLEYLGPLTDYKGLRFVEFITAHASRELISICSDFFGGTWIPQIAIRFDELPENIKWTEWLELMRCMKQEKLLIDQLQLTKDSYKFLVQLSDIVEVISIEVHDDEFDYIPVWVLKQMLNGKQLRKLLNCDYSLFISFWDAEKLVQFLHHIGKKAMIEARFDDHHHQTNQVGEYKIDINAGEILIAHLDFLEDS